MERILTVEKVAEILCVKPFTVRQMFREGRLSGFKVGKAWRITESALQADIRRMGGITGAPEAVPMEEVVQGNLAGVNPVQQAGTPSDDKAEVRVSPKGPGRDMGHLLVFSDVPGQEVFLDGVRKGPTTLSIMNVETGEHTLRVGDVTERVTIHKDARLRVCLEEGRLEVLSQPEMVTLGSHADALEKEGLENYRLRINLENRTDFSGRFCVRLGAVAHVERIARHDITVIFDGVIKARPGDQLAVCVPDQPGFYGYAEQVYAVESDMTLNLTLARQGLFRAKDVIRFKLDVESEH